MNKFVLDILFIITFFKDSALIKNNKTKSVYINKYLLHKQKITDRSQK